METNTDQTPGSKVDNVTPTQDTTPKMVPEKDLMAVKEGAERKVKELEADFQKREDEYKQKISATTDELLKATAAVKQLEERISEGSTSTEEVEKGKQALAAEQERSKGLETKLLGVRINHIATAYGIPKEKLEDKTSEQLDLFEDALKAIGKATPRTSKYDVGGVGTTTAPMTPLEKCKEEMKLATRVGGGSLKED